MSNLYAGWEFCFVFKKPTCLWVGVSIHRHLKLIPFEVLNIYSALYGYTEMLQWGCLCRIRILFELEIQLVKKKKKCCCQDLKTRARQAAWFALILMLLQIIYWCLGITRELHVLNENKVKSSISGKVGQLSLLICRSNSSQEVCQSKAKKEE